MQFNAGDEVQIKSGSDVMTVEAVEGDKVKCVWMVSGHVKRDTFVAAVLVKNSPQWSSSSQEGDYQPT
jgi:uncharacterized protein YodC (DUF2158 family)